MHRHLIRAVSTGLSLLTVLLAAAVLVPPALAGDGDLSRAAFERLKGLEGTWKAHMPADHGEPTEGTHVFRISAAGTVVMETMGPGTEHEMINMYHLDGDDLMLTHYCAGGNQPVMRLAEGSTPSLLKFDFAGGTNLDPAKDDHIHAARLSFREDGGVDSIWTSWKGGAESETLTFPLTREK